MLSPASLETVLADVDAVIHLAAVDESISMQDPELALKVNGQGTYSLLDSAYKRGVVKFVYLSTFHVYGPTAKSPITEETVTRPVHPYAITHRLAEDLTNWYRHSMGLETLILRLSNGYGFPADPMVDRWNLVFNDMCHQAVKNREIKLRSKGTQHRDFVSISDLTRALVHLLSLPAEDLGTGLFNIGGECSLPIIGVAEKIAKTFLDVYGEKIEVVLGESEDVGGGLPVVYNIDRIKSTGFSLTGDMNYEIRKTFEVCEDLLHRSNGR